MRRSHLALLLSTLVVGAFAVAGPPGSAEAEEATPRLVVFELFNDTGIPGG